MPILAIWSDDRRQKPVRILKCFSAESFLLQLQPAFVLEKELKAFHQHDLLPIDLPVNRKVCEN